MFSRIRIAVGLALLLTLIISITAYAKGNFTFISVTGPNLKEEVRVSDPAFTTDFFAFADFSQNETEAPADPGLGYDITRYYVDRNSEIAFDRLHYYPDASLVYYDGIAGGWSEYDGKWYTAKPGLKTAFETAVSNQLRLSAAATPETIKATPETAKVTSEPVKALVPPTVPATVPANVPVQSQPTTPFTRTQTILFIIVAAGLTAILELAFLRFRRLAHR